MNRFKKYVRSKGIKLECDYPWLPYDIKPYINIEAVYVNASTATIVTFYNVGDFHQHINRDGSIEVLY